MSLGHAPETDSALHSTTSYCEANLGPTSIYRFLHDHGEELFPDEAFADLFQTTGRASVPPRIVAIVMVLQRLEGLSDREAVERFAFDLRWKYAAGGLDFEHPGFVHTVLVDMRARLRLSERPNRIFEVVLQVAKRSGLVGHKRVLDSAPLYDAVATQDTVTLIRAAIRGVLQAAEADEGFAAELRGVLKRDDDYERAGKPICDWEDAQARQALVDALCKDGYAVLAHLENRRVSRKLRQASKLLATVLGQDIETDDTGAFRIARRVAPDRVISTVDPEARHGHKTQARSFDGYKGHISIDPDSEIITATAVTPGNRSDGEVAEELLAEAFQPTEASATASPCEPLEVYGDAAYGTGALLATVAEQGAVPYLKVPPPQACKGMFPKDRFVIELDERRVTCPAGGTATIHLRSDGSGTASFGAQCRTCAFRPQCTTCADGRNVTIHAQEELVAQARQQQRTDPEWRKRYRSTRPKVERKLAHLVRRKHGGRRARLIGTLRIAWDFALLAAATNLQRMANLLLVPLVAPEPALVPE